MLQKAELTRSGLGQSAEQLAEQALAEETLSPARDAARAAHAGPCTRAAGTARIRAPRIVSIACAYPRPGEPGLGVFVQRRLQHLAEFAELAVISPLPVLEYGNPHGKRLRLAESDCPRFRQDGQVPVFSPRWFYPPMAGFLNDFALSLQLIRPMQRLRKQFPFEIIDTHFGHPDGVAGAVLSAILNVPFTMTLRGNEPMHCRSRAQRRCMAWAVRRASRVFAVSERLRQFAIELGAEPRRTRTIPNGVDTAVFFPRDPAECRARFGLAAGQPVILSAGSLIELKGHHRIVRSMHALSDQGMRAQLLIAGGPGRGGGPYETTLRRLISELGLAGQVQLLGSVPQQKLAELMSAADILCLASSREGWPNVVHEALACGTPVVATDVGAVPEMLPGEDYGLVVPAGDAAALERALARSLQTRWDRQAIADWGQSRSWRQVAREVQQQMQEIILEQHAKTESGIQNVEV